MSYDIRYGVEVKDANGLIAEVGRPEHDTPTYNLSDMFRKCMDWDYEQGKWYRVTEVLPKILHGIQELQISPKKYKKYEPSNGWGSTRGALECLQSIVEGIADYQNGWEQDIPVEYLWIKW